MSRIKVDAIETTSGAPRYLTQAWVCMNAVTTLTVRASGNVSSAVDVAVGVQTVNFSNSFQDQSFALGTSGERNLTGATRTLLVSLDSAGGNSVQTGSVRLLSQSDTNANEDGRYVNMMATR